MICKGCGYKGQSKDFIQGGIYVCPKCASLSIRIDKPTPLSPPKNGHEMKPEVGVKRLGDIPLGNPGIKRLADIPLNLDNPPRLSPSGKPASGYGEITIRVWLTGPKEDPTKSAEAAIFGPEMPFPFWMVGCEHLMTMTAQKSKAGFEKALELLAEGAMTNRGRLVKK